MKLRLVVSAISYTTLLISASVSSIALSQEFLPDVGSDQSEIDGGFLSGTGGTQKVYRSEGSTAQDRVFGADSVDALTRQLSKARGGADIAATLVEISSSVDEAGGNTSAWFEQRIGGLRVYGSYAKTVLSDSGELLFSAQKLAPALNALGKSPRINSRDALNAVINANHPNAKITTRINLEGNTERFAKGDYFFKAPSVERVFFYQNNILEYGYLVENWSGAENLLYETLVDGNDSDRIRFYNRHPDASNARTRRTPSRWTTGTQNQLQLQGPNVRAYLDRDANNIPDASGAVITDGLFTGSANLSQAPTTRQNQRAAIQNLFYWNNFIHDYLEPRGFDSGNGHFEGSDPVLAEAQDGSSFNNANFATPSVGSPRMQMFLWNRTNPNRDGDLDSDVIWHEYGHGVTWRMVGDMRGDVAGALGEGNSDALAILFTNNDRVGEYSLNNANGIRSNRYGAHRETLGDYNRLRGVHRNGEIYAAALWRLRIEYRSAGIRNKGDLIRDIIQGYRFTPSRPTYIEMRDGLLQAAPAARDCLIWRAFARKGMGTGAQMSETVDSRGDTTRVTVRENFDLPSACR